MELIQEPRFFCRPVTVLDTVAEQLADVDLTLPDYCPDIEKILKCTLTPKIQSKSLSGGQLQVEGFCVVNVMYVESINNTIRCCEQSVNFSQNFSVKDTGDAPVIVTKTKSEYINCRALSPRRLVMHGAFSLYAKVIASEQTNLYSNDNPDLETLSYNVKCADLKSLCQENFSVSEELSISDKPAIEAILHSDVSVGVTDAKAVTGKLMLNGEINLRLFYLTDVQSGETGKIDYIMPFNQIIDCKGIDENTINHILCEVMSYDIRLKNDMLSDKPAIALDVKLCVTEEGYVVNEEKIITDAYSVKFASEPKFTKMNICEEVAPVNESHMQKMEIGVDNGKISKVLDIYTDCVTAESTFDNEELKINGKIMVCMLALDEDGMPVFIERSSDFSHGLSFGGCNIVSNASARASSISYRLADDNTVEIRCEIKLGGCAVCQKSITAVCETEIFEDRPIKSDGCALTLYFAGKGENLWEIAKSHNTRLGMLMNENSTDCECLDSPQMLLIPKI